LKRIKNDDKNFWKIYIRKISMNDDETKQINCNTCDKANTLESNFKYSSFLRRELCWISLKVSSTSFELIERNRMLNQSHVPSCLIKLRGIHKIIIYFSCFCWRHSTLNFNNSWRAIGKNSLRIVCGSFCLVFQLDFFVFLLKF
jgi:hypothetical protein